MHWNLLLSSGSQVISNNWLYCDTSKLSYEFILMICDLSWLCLHSLEKSVTLTFLNANTETVLSEHKCYVCEIFSGRQPWNCSSISEIDSLPIFTVITVPGCLGKKMQMANLSHAVYRKTAHTDLYQHLDSEHRSGHAKGCSVHCYALHCCCDDDDSLKEETEHLKQAFRNNWKSIWVI